MFPIHKEIEEDQNVALGIVIGSIMIGIAHYYRRRNSRLILKR
jgi:hypothetical protein